MIKSLFDAIDQLDILFYDLKYSLPEGEILREYYKRHSLKIKTKEEKAWINFDGTQLLLKINKYRNSLKEYRQNYEFYDNTNSIQERDIKFTTNKFFTEIVSPIRVKALSSLGQLKLMIQNTKIEKDKNQLNTIMSQMIISTNELIDACIRVIQINKPELIQDLKNKGIDFKQKYELLHITIQDI